MLMKKLVPLFVLITTTLMLHGIWEHAHIGLYTGYEALQGALPVWILATLGDLLYTFGILGIISIRKRGIAWVRDASAHDMIVVALLGFLVALMVEYKGLYLGRWQYLPSMPIVPLLAVGLSPLLQMTLLTPLSLFVTKVLSRRIYQTIH
jgi:hypothetical protein